MRMLFGLLLILISPNVTASGQDIFMGVPDEQVSQVELFEFHSPELQDKALRLAKSLRCPQCQNQNLVESNSPIAKDLRLIVFKKINQGESEQSVKAFMTERYGKFVLYKPEFNVANALLWLAPVLLLLLFVVSSIRRIQKNA
ncbi:MULTISPECIES: cytochrome c-type biogenesis protein CcmH [Vibrio]|uniref:cytochrome c-type biogenesis protein CcmH n=1 Tax=Vibrio TaxID=662 RepID=UPI002075079B|nr:MULTISPECIES: cytochrome c-type biogenesis protein CcmH [Vibrio]USD33238.1 cytochrome c-type biogenesis protein CcmH [Vibrio sp. SCSIO 43186]USD46307.1 cytochrome c-type biogenesis protein CcmH [Vibrio sp. SCSIO 43145]USD70362.1 cytochrome c-type biogenesis protein CcmH [Vibrio sp. SCSIO 43139]USD95280.1 heme lyase NrfEFG subunit NrfF [Vibrio coralliilyticus]